ncbi:MAG: PaaI family thioesterase [Gammaproteobacteria bacterium]|nr:PaaI family thioesterase [Gammaproteobacteria bacterium]
MTDTETLPPGVPKTAVVVHAHSNFGSEIGYCHYIDEAADPELVYYLGLTLQEKHAGAPGRGHGAVTMAMLDDVMGRAASKSMNQLCYTATMTTNFCAASRVGQFLLARATVSRKGKNLVFVDATLHAEDCLIATATGTWANSGLPIPGAGAKD